MFDTQIEVLIHTFVHTISLPSKEMGRESIEEGELSTPLVAKEEHHQLYAVVLVVMTMLVPTLLVVMMVVRVRVDLPQPQVWLCLALWLLSLVPMFLAQL